MTEALQYHNLCVEILLPELSSEHISEEILTSVAILRQLEEMDGRYYMTTYLCVLTSPRRG